MKFSVPGADALMLGGKTVAHVTYKLIQTCLASALVEKYRKGNWEQEQRCEGPVKGEPWSEQRPRVDGRAAWSYGGRAAQSPGRPVPRPWAGAACSLGDRPVEPSEQRLKGVRRREM